MIKLPNLPVAGAQHSLITERLWGGSGDEFGSGVSVDSAGNIYLAGRTYNFSGVGGAGAFLLKYNSSDALQWQRIWSNGGYDFGTGAATNGSTSVYLAVTESTGGNSGEGFLLKFDSFGNLIWQREMHGQSNGVAVDGTGSIYVVGDIEGFGGIFLAKFNSTGGLLWEKDWIGTGQGNSVALDASGNIYVTGWTNGQGYGVGILWLAKFDLSGTILWQETWSPGSNYDSGNGLAIDLASGDIYLTGVSETDLARCGANIQILKISSGGTLLWQKTWGCKEYDIGTAVAVDQSTHLIYVTGTFRDGGGPLLLKLDPNGTMLDARILASGGGGSGVAVGLLGNVIVVGTISSPQSDCLEAGNNTLDTPNLELLPSGLTFIDSGLQTSQGHGSLIAPPQSFVTLGGLDAFLLDLSPVTASVPAPPSDVLAKGANGIVSLSWKAPLSNGSAPVIGYNVYRSKTLGCESLKPIARVLGATSYTDMNLVNGQTYFYQIAAFNTLGEGPRSSFAVAAPLTPITDYNFRSSGSNFTIETNATLTKDSFSYNPTGNLVSFRVSGQAGSGFANITIPKPLIVNASSVTIALNGSLTPFLFFSGQKNFYLYTSFPQSNLTITVSLGMAPNPSLYLTAIFVTGFTFGGVVMLVVRRIIRKSIIEKTSSKPLTEDLATEDSPN